jgi:hypothetical protein
MMFNRNAGGHAFDINRVCVKCGMSYEHFDDAENHKPYCKGVKPPHQREREIVAD